MRTIGTDINLDTCKDEGYMIMKYDARHKFSHDIDVIVEQYLPDYIRDEMSKRNGKKVSIDHGKQWTRINTNDIWGLYQDHKNGIQSFADYHVENISEIKDYYDLLTLADIVNAYIGIFTY